MQTIPLTFPGAHGVHLSARLELPETTPRAFALFAHCFTCGKNLKAVHTISRALAAVGIAVLRFDFTGLGESEGDFEDTTFASNVADLTAAAEFLATAYQAPSLLIGHSLGGAAVIHAAAQLPDVRAVVTIAAPSEPSHVVRLLEHARPEIEAQGCAIVKIGGRPFPIRKEFLEDLEATRMESVTRSLRRPLLVMHSPRDTTVGIDNAARIYQAAIHPKSFFSLDDADHLLSRAEDSRYAAGMIAAWADRYLPAEPAAPATEVEGVVVEIGRQGYTSNVYAGRHAFIADEPLRFGGADQGPGPYDYLLAALGACTVMTLRMYADRKKWPLEAAKVRLSHGKIHALDCAECETKEGTIDRIERVLELTGPLDAEQQARLVEIADRCPVHRTLHAEISIRTSLYIAEESTANDT
ncbi:MAG: OsmC family protein [Oscillochloris sp.]|nr:OsmC family protein [Oscillochloris sp.]